MSDLITAQIAALITMAIGTGAVLLPQSVIKFLGLAILPERKDGITEIRATLGGLFFTAAGFALFTNSPLTYGLLGAGWTGAAVIRAITMFPDRSITRHNVVSIIVELAMGAALLWPYIRLPYS